MEDTTTTFQNFCEMTSPILEPIGEVLLLFKIFIPLILIIICTIDIIKLIMSNKTKKDDGKKTLKSTVLRIILAIAIFFVPAIYMLIFSFVPGYSQIRKSNDIDYAICYDCLFKPNSDTCKTAVRTANRELEEY